MHAMNHEEGQNQYDLVVIRFSAILPFSSLNACSPIKVWQRARKSKSLLKTHKFVPAFKVREMYGTELIRNRWYAK